MTDMGHLFRHSAGRQKQQSLPTTAPRGAHPCWGRLPSRWFRRRFVTELDHDTSGGIMFDVTKKEASARLYVYGVFYVTMG